MSEVPSPGEPSSPVGVRSWGAFARQLWLGAVPVLFVAMVIAAATYGWRAYQSAAAKARDRQVCEELQAFLVQFQDARDNPSPDIGPVRASAKAIGASIPEAMKRDLSPGLPARQLLLWAARDDLPRMVEEDRSAVSEAEVEFVRKMEQASLWLDLPPPTIRRQPRRVAEALAEIEQLGGVVETDESRSIQPVTAIEMRGDQFKDEHLVHLPNVNSLTIDSSHVTDTGLQNLGRNRNLTTLRLTCANVTDAGIANVAALPALSTVHLLKCSRITDNGILSFKNARKLVLSGTHITDQTLAILRDFPRLAHLSLRSDSLSDEGMSLLASHAGLTTLFLSHCHYLSDEGLSRIAEIQTLETLGVEGVDLTDLGLDSVGTLTRLTRLMILPCNDRMPGGLRITDNGLIRMKNLPGLHSLAIESSPGVTDKSVGVLTGMSSLTYLQLKETGITTPGHLQIVSSLPKTRVDFVPTRPSPLDGTLAVGTGKDAPQLTVVPSCEGWPVPDSKASLGGSSTVEELENEYRKDREATDTKYIGKWVDLSGPVSHIGKNLEGDPVIRLRGSDDRFKIDCVLRSEGDQTDVVEGETCHLRGVYCASVLPVFVRCTVNKSVEGGLIDAVEGTDAPVEPNRKLPDVTLTAEQLDAEIDADSREAERKYAGKTLQVTGRLSRISPVTSSAMVYRLGPPFGTQFYLRTGNPWYCARPGQTVTLVGKWFHAYPCLVDCDVISVTGAPSPTISAIALGEYLESDRVQFHKWFSSKQFIVSGEVVQKSAPEAYPDQISITLRSTLRTTVVCGMEIDELRATESVKVGDFVTITGRITNGTPPDMVDLYGCLFWRGK